MNDITRDMPLSLDHTEDGRYFWPARWKMLFKQIDEMGTKKKEGRRRGEVAKDKHIETCILCGDPTDMAGRADDSLYCDWKVKPPALHYEQGDEIGPLCLSCYDCLMITGFIE